MAKKKIIVQTRPLYRFIYVIDNNDFHQVYFHCHLNVQQIKDINKITTSTSENQGSSWFVWNSF